MNLSPARKDLSRALIHLTGNRKKTSAIKALISILKEGCIRASSNSGFIKGTQPASCFTEMPLSCVEAFVYQSQRSPKKHPYDNYGIALSKQNAWERGARPVIYLPDNEADWIPAAQRWRHVRYEFASVDFSHEREWRSPGDFSLKGIGFYVIVPNKEIENEIQPQLPDMAIEHILGYLHMDILNQFI